MAEEKTFEDYFNEAINDDTTEENNYEQEQEPRTEEPNVEGETPEEETASQGNTVQEPDTPSELDSLKSELENLKEEIAQKDHKMASWEGRIKKANDEKKAIQAELDALKDSKSDGFKPSEDLDDKELLKEFLTEFPDLKKPIQLLASQIADAKFDEHFSKLEPKLKKIETTIQETTEEAHFKAIKDAHSDWTTVVASSAFKEWINSQPTYVNRELVRICESGTASEVVEMLTNYKESTKQKTEIVQKKDMQNLVAVPARSGGPPPNEPARNDFDAAWDEAISS